MVKMLEINGNHGCSLRYDDQPVTTTDSLKLRGDFQAMASARMQSNRAGNVRTANLVGGYNHGSGQ